MTTLDMRQLGALIVELGGETDDCGNALTTGLECYLRGFARSQGIYDPATDRINLGGAE